MQVQCLQAVEHTNVYQNFTSMLYLFERQNNNLFLQITSTSIRKHSWPHYKPFTG